MKLTRSPKTDPGAALSAGADASVVGASVTASAVNGLGDLDRQAASGRDSVHNSVGYDDNADDDNADDGSVYRSNVYSVCSDGLGAHGDIATALPALPRAFYLLPTLDTAQRLLNCLLVRVSSDGITIGRISETEAYTQDDPACHAFTRKTARNAPMFGPPAHAYMHMNYGLHWCFNAVTAPTDCAEAVLIRAVEPLMGLELMRLRRGLAQEDAPLPPASAAPDGNTNANAAAQHAKQRAKIGHFLCGGPGKLSAAFGLDKTFNHHDLTTGQGLWIAPPTASTGYALAEDIVASGRIGITRAANYPWRFYLKNDPYISRK